MATDTTFDRAGPDRASLLYDPKVRGILFQILIVVLLVAFGWWFVENTIDNLRRSNIASGFGFLDRRAGFDLAFSLIPYSSDSTIGRALLVGMINTVLIAVSGIATATIVGFIIGIGRLSRNWLIARICTVYVEVFRNIPPLLVIFFWYLGVLSVLPQPRQSIALGIPFGVHTKSGVIGFDYFLSFGAYLNSRGFFLPRTVWGEGAWLIPVALAIAIAMTVFVARRARQRQMETGERFPVLWTSVGLIVGLPVLAFLAMGLPLSFEVPKLSTFNLTGGWNIKPEFLSLYLALSFYTASFIAEIVRAGVLGVPKGQTEASLALGLTRGQALRLVVVPQALRIVIPPLTSQYLNLTKNSSLAVAIGYPELVAVGGTILNQTGQSIEIVLIWMVVYLGLSLVTAFLMNWFNARMALVER